MAAPPPPPNPPPGSSQLQKMLQSAVQAVQWTYSLFWHFCPQQGVLVWADGYYNGAIKTRKTVQPMEVSAEEASLQRSQQLRELYDSLSAGETNPPARRPCASLSPEDLTESEWFYLMCVSFSFPPGVGLPGKAYSKRQHAWLTGANEVDSKVFSRAILAKSARIQTVVCIPLLDGVVELGSTERIQEDVSFVHHVKTFFVDHHQYQPPLLHEDDHHHHHIPPPKPALSEHSTSNPAPAAASDHPTRFHSLPVPAAMYSTLGHGATTNNNHHHHHHHHQDVDVDVDEEEDDDEDEEGESDSETETAGRNSRPTQQNLSAQNLTFISGAQAAAEQSELMQLEMSEDIRLGSPDDASNNLESSDHFQMTTGVSGQQPTSRNLNVLQRRAASMRAESEPFRRWPAVQGSLNNGIQAATLPPGGAPHLEELSQEDTHYSQTVSTILQYQTGRLSETTTTTMSSSSHGYLRYSPNSAFLKWSSKSEVHVHVPIDGVSQWLLKYVLFTIPLLHNKYHRGGGDDENSPKCRDPTDASSRLRNKGTTPQDELSANHVLAERRRREKLNERFIILRSLVPFVTKLDKASILGDTIEYVKQLRKKIQDLEARARQMETDHMARTGTAHPIDQPPAATQLPTDLQRTTNNTSQKDQRSSASGSSSGGGVSTRIGGPSSGGDKRKVRVLEASGGSGGRTKAVEAPPPPSPPPPSPPSPADMLQVSIIESDALIELHCPYKEGLLLDVMLTLREKSVEVTAVQSSLNNGFFIAELRAKVKENWNGKKPSIVEVKRAINQIVPHTE
ncbi:Transcription factor bhlh42 [Dionaea muscipula]